MPYAFGAVIKEEKSITFNNYTLIHSNTKEELFNIMREYHALIRKANLNLKVASDKTKFFYKK